RAVPCRPPWTCYGRALSTTACDRALRRRPLSVWSAHPRFILPFLLAASVREDHMRPFADGGQVLDEVHVIKFIKRGIKVQRIVSLHLLQNLKQRSSEIAIQEGPHLVRVLR